MGVPQASAFIRTRHKYFPNASLRPKSLLYAMPKRLYALCAHLSLMLMRGKTD